MRITNRQIITELMPIMREAEKRTPELVVTDYYGHPYYAEYYAGGIQVRWTDFGAKGKPAVVIEVYKSLKGRYDGATLERQTWRNDNKYGYSKEFTGKGNGYYADLDGDGRVICDEWD